MKKEWFEEWFDSPYYHLLYKSRDDREAKAALDHLLRALDLEPGSRVLDLACGRGRHSRYLSEKGFEVTGLDISPGSIAFARQFEHARLEFYQHDMRKPFRINYFEAVMNMFTSFGYFKTDTDHLLAMKNAAKGLRPGGQFLMDFFNTAYVRHNLVHEEQKTVGGVTFSLSRRVRKGHVFKTVEFSADGKNYRYQERVRLFELGDFQSLLAASGLRLRRTFGDYDLSGFDPRNSKRLIFIADKP